MRPLVRARRSSLVHVTILLFFAILVEGIARKWLFPAQHEYFYFMRDPLVLVLYFLALKHKVLRAIQWCVLWLGAAYLISLMSLLVYMTNDYSPWVWALGVRNYFMCIPLAFIVAQSFEREDFRRFATLVAIVAVPTAFVCVQQFFATPGEWINLGAGGAIPPALAGDVMRTTGLLASDAQHVPYMVFTVSVLGAAFVGTSFQSPKKDLLLLAGGVAALAMMVVSGSRAVWFQAAGVGLGALAASFITPSGTATRLRSIMVPSAAAILVAIMFTNVFTQAYEAYGERNRVAGTLSAATIERIADMFLPGWMFEASIGGDGIGISMTGAGAITSGERGFTKAESEWDRNFVELGLLGGGIFVALRITFAVWLVWIGYRAACIGDPTALVLASFAAPAILITQITMHTVYGHFAWFAAGLTMAAARSALVQGVAWTDGVGTCPHKDSWPGRLSRRRRARLGEGHPGASYLR